MVAVGGKASFSNLLPFISISLRKLLQPNDLTSSSSSFSPSTAPGYVNIIS